MTNNSKYVVKNTKTNKYYKRGTLEWGNSPNDAYLFHHYEYSDALRIANMYLDLEVVEYWQALQDYSDKVWSNYELKEKN
jgi:hypothetical protein